MDFSLSDLAPVATIVGALAAQADWILAAAVFTMTASAMAFGIPGILVPLSVASGAFLGPGYTAAAVALGGVVGGQILFLASRRALKGRMGKPRSRIVASIASNFSRYGLWYVVGLRLTGVPHLAVTSACAVLPISSRAFAAATMLGLLPVAFIAASFGDRL
jgi:uncharacterized membrane protein YdjX (TVP38/TMEM64 family)